MVHNGVPEGLPIQGLIPKEPVWSYLRNLTVLLERSLGGKAVPPLRSDFPDFGPIPDFFDESGPEMVRFCLKSPDSR